MAHTCISVERPADRSYANDDDQLDVPARRCLTEVKLYGASVSPRVRPLGRSVHMDTEVYAIAIVAHKARHQILARRIGSADPGVDQDRPCW